MIYKMWAHEYPTQFRHFGSKSFVQLHQINQPLVQVELTETPDGRYWGWLANDAKEPKFIWPSKLQLDLCFPSGADIAQAMGSGKVMRFDVKKV